MADMADIAQITQALVVRPGDTLVIRVPMNVSRSAFQDLFESIRAEIDDDVRLLVVSAEQLAVIHGTSRD